MKDDAIYRQDAIDAAIEAADDWDGGCSKERDRFIRDALEELPSVQPEWKWIPVSKRPPDEGTYVLISKKPSPLSGKEWCVTIAGRFVDGRSGKVEWRDIGFGRMYDNDILAWMPRPKPVRLDGE